MLILKSNNPELYHIILKPLGMSHGFLFIAYIVRILLKKSARMELGNFRNYFSCIFNPFGTFYIEKNTVNMFKSAAEIFTFCIPFRK
jgi:hypothetical protein